MDGRSQPNGSIGDDVADHCRRFFIISTGRTGSTLLSVILAEAGAQFGMGVPDDWDRGAGDMEHPELVAASRRIAAARELSLGRPQATLLRYRWTMLRSLGKRRLRSALAETRYVKVAHADLLVRPAVKLGFFPSIILSYRRFEDHAISLGMMFANASVEVLVENYNRVNRNGLWLLNTFGGCVVGYEQLTDLDDRSWVEPLACVTNLPAARLLAARDRRVEAPSRPVDAPHFDRAAQQTYGDLQALRGLAIAPSTQALRSWQTISGAAHRAPVEPEIS